MTLAPLHAVLRQALTDHASTDQEVARFVLAELGVRGKASDLLVPLVAQETNWVRRIEWRAVEKRAARDLRSALGPTVDVSGARAELLASSFPLGDGRWVTWGEATIADHEARIDFLAKQRDGIVATIGRHADAIDTIKEAGVACLREIEEAA